MKGKPIVRGTVPRLASVFAGAVIVAASACRSEAPRETPPRETPPRDTPAAARPGDTLRDVTEGGVVARFRQRIPEDALIRRGACPFECCVYRDWTATGAIPVVPDELSTASPIFTIAAGERFRADTGNVHVTSVAPVVVRDSVGDPPYWSFGVGDTIVVLDYVGEGFYNVWHEGDVKQVPAFWASTEQPGRAELIGSHETEWWVHVTMPDGRTGWIRADTAPPVTGADACA